MYSGGNDVVELKFISGPCPMNINAGTSSGYTENHTPDCLLYCGILRHSLKVVCEPFVPEHPKGVQRVTCLEIWLVRAIV